MLLAPLVRGEHEPRRVGAARQHLTAPWRRLPAQGLAGLHSSGVALRGRGIVPLRPRDIFAIFARASDTLAAYEAWHAHGFLCRIIAGPMAAVDSRCAAGRARGG